MIDSGGNGIHPTRDPPQRTLQRGAGVEHASDTMQVNEYDTRDPAEHVDVATILGVLPENHPARTAYARGTGTLGIMHLCADRPELVEDLKDAWLVGSPYGRIFGREKTGSRNPRKFLTLRCCQATSQITIGVFARSDYERVRGVRSPLLSLGDGIAHYAKS